MNRTSGARSSRLIGAEASGSSEKRERTSSCSARSSPRAFQPVAARSASCQLVARRAAVEERRDRAGVPRLRSARSRRATPDRRAAPARPSAPRSPARATRADPLVVAQRIEQPAPLLARELRPAARGLLRAIGDALVQKERLVRAGRLLERARARTRARPARTARCAGAWPRRRGSRRRRSRPSRSRSGACTPRDSARACRAAPRAAARARGRAAPASPRAPARAPRPPARRTRGPRTGDRSVTRKCSDASERVSQVWPSRAFASASSCIDLGALARGRIAPAVGHAARGREHGVERVARGLEPAAVALDLREQERRLRPRRLVALQAPQRAQARLQVAALDVRARREHRGEVAVVVVARARAARQRLADPAPVPVDREVLGRDALRAGRGQYRDRSARSARPRSTQTATSLGRSAATASRSRAIPTCRRASAPTGAFSAPLAAP